MTTCAECVHVGVCRDYILSLSKAKGKDIDESKLVKLETMFDTDGCEHFKDRSRFVELPDVGSTVFELVKINTLGDYRVQDFKVTSRIIDTNGVAFDVDLIGKRIFLTPEEAEAALREREENGGL